DNMFVNADRGAIHQILSNICDNAIKFSKEGGRYEISIRDVGQKTVVSVYNEGIGIAAEELPYVFDRFYKSDKSRGLDKTGVGLGLFIARTIIEAHNETIKVESEYGKWCRFTFTLQKTNRPAPTNKETETQ
ncbi:MAG: sensor histidine kinase, partial [Clostridia bacterium]|nr:sensor histidine kinase [Clostridia bacterium]